MSLRALLFDVDGTLADTEAYGHLPAYNRTFRDLGLDWKWSKPLYRDLLLLPGGRERIAYYMAHYDPDLGSHDAEIQQDEQAWIEAVHQRKSRHFRQRLKTGRIPLRAGVERLITQAHDARMRIAIVTNASRATLRPFLRHALGARLCSYIQVVISGEQVENKKPAPDAYRKACERLDCRPEECVAIEDSAMGLAAARAARIPALVTINDDTRRQEFKHANLVVDSLGEPGQAITIIQSAGFDFGYVDLSVLERLHAGAGPPPRRGAASKSRAQSETAAASEPGRVTSR